MYLTAAELYTIPDEHRDLLVACVKQNNVDGHLRGTACDPTRYPLLREAADDIRLYLKQQVPPAQIEALERDRDDAVAEASELSEQARIAVAAAERATNESERLLSECKVLRVRRTKFARLSSMWSFFQSELGEALADELAALGFALNAHGSLDDFVSDEG